MYSEQILAVLEQFKALRLRVFNLLENGSVARGGAHARTTGSSKPCGLGNGMG